MIGLDKLADRLGELAWISAALFELEGTRAAGLPDAATVHLGTHSRHHGWHAQLLTEALPDSPALGSTDRVQPPSQGWTAAQEMVLSLPPNDTVGLLTALYRHLVPRAATASTALLIDLSGPGDAALHRVVSFVVADQREDLAVGSGLLVASLTSTESRSRAAVVSGSLDELFAR